jgi:hypothetical protein
VGPLAPIDSLDAVAQKHDFGYKVAEALGNGRPAYISYYKAMADSICAREAAALAKNPADWPHPPADIQQARKLRDRMVVGFGDVVQNINSAKGLLRKRFDRTDEEEIEGLVDLDSFETKQNAEVASWNQQHAKWQAQRAAKGKSTTSASHPAQASASTFGGTWSGTYNNSRNEPGSSETILVETNGKVEGTDGGLKILDGRRTGDTMTWRLEKGGGAAKGGVTWNMTVQILDNGNTLVERYTGRDHRTDKHDGGSYTGVATLHRK